MNMQLAPLSDLDDLLVFYKKVALHMLENGNPQWGTDYPNREFLNEDLEEKNLYKLLDDDGTLLGVIVLNRDEGEPYERFTWEDTSDRHIVIHRLAVSPAAQGRGVGRALMEWAENHGREVGYSSIRLDTYVGNPTALALYDKMGYRRVGVTGAYDTGWDYVFFEKVL